MKKTIYLALFIVALCEAAASPVFIQPVHDQTFNITEDDEFIYMIHAFDPMGNYPINFTDDSNDPSNGLYAFRKMQVNSSSARINFTPTNDYVGSFSFHIIATNSVNDPPSTITVHFNINNSNDAPQFISTIPANNSDVSENQSLTFSVISHDDDLDFGDNITFTWHVDGIASPKLSGIKLGTNASNATYTPLIEEFDAGMHDISVIAADKSGAYANYTWAINVINVNRPPVANGTILDVVWPEDSNLTDSIVLTHHLYDPDTNGSLCEIDTGYCLDFGYEYTSGNSSLIAISIDEYGNVSFYPAKDWYGSLQAAFWVFDNYSKTYSNTVILNVTNVNDAPVLDMIPPLQSYENAVFSYTANASDADNDTIVFHVGCPTLAGIQVEPTTGVISLQSATGDSGIHTVTVYADDGLINGTTSFNLQIHPNARPQIVPFADMTINQHTTLSFIVEGIDADSEQLFFWTNVSALGQGARSNDTAWNFTFTPASQLLVGNISVALYANDTHNAIDQYNFTIEVVDVPMAPLMQAISVPNDQIKVNKTLQLIALANDEEGNIVGFHDNTSMFDIITLSNGSMSIDAAANITFMPDATGYHVVNISAEDATGLFGWTLLVLNITLNHDPYFTSISNITTEENELYEQTIIADDFDWQDELAYGSNMSGLVSQDGSINHSFSSMGQFEVIVWVSDGESNISTSLAVNITEIDDPPYFLDNISALPAWASIMENTTTMLQLTAADEEYNLTGQLLNLTISFINFTNIAGSTTYSGISLFNFYDVYLNADNTTTGSINISPGPFDVGSYWVNISVSDNNSVTSHVFGFNVQNLNNLPVINWSLSYPSQSVFIAQNALQDFSLNCSENESLSITTWVSDADFDPIQLRWYEIDYHGQAILIGNTSNLSYLIPFYAYPSEKLVLEAYDGHAYTNATWNLGAANVNRNITFGQHEYPLSNGGNTSNMTFAAGGLVLSKMNATHYFGSGAFVSETMDFLTSSLDLPRLDLATINLTNSDQNPGYDISIYTAASNNAAVGESWTLYENGSINTPDYRYLKLKLAVNSSGDSTPNITSMMVNFWIKGLQAPATTIYADYLDLDHFFIDPDQDDVLYYNYSIISGEDVVALNIQQRHYASIEFLAEGTAQFIFNASDLNGGYAQSNMITAQVTTSGTSDASQSQSSSSSSSTQTRTETQVEYQYKKQDVPIALDIIHPGEVTIYDNETISIPVEFRNNDKFNLEGLHIRAFSEQEGLETRLDSNFIDRLGMNSSKTITLALNMDKLYGSYDVFIEVNVTDPAFQDTAKILVSSLKRARFDDENQNLKLAFVSDLLSRSEDCAELSEYIDRAKEHLSNGETAQGVELLDKFIDDCKMLVARKEQHEESPSMVTANLINALTGNPKTLAIAVFLAALTVATSIAGLAYAYKKI